MLELTHTLRFHLGHPRSGRSAQGCRGGAAFAAAEEESSMKNVLTPPPPLRYSFRHGKNEVRPFLSRRQGRRASGRALDASGGSGVAGGQLPFRRLAPRHPSDLSSHPLPTPARV